MVVVPEPLRESAHIIPVDGISLASSFFVRKLGVSLSLRSLQLIQNTAAGVLTSTVTLLLHWHLFKNVLLTF